MKNEYYQLQNQLEMVKLRQNMVQMNTQVMESTVGFEENRELRQELDQLHEQYNNIIDEKNHQYAQNFQQAPRKSGYGKKTVKQIGQPKEVRSSYYTS